MSYRNYSLFMLLILYLFIGVVSASLRGIIIQNKVDSMILDIAKHSIWTIQICRNDVFYYELSDEHIRQIKNIFSKRSISYTEDGYCKFLFIEFQSL